MSWPGVVLAILGGVALGAASVMRDTEVKRDQVCVTVGLKSAQATADLARVEGEIRAEDPDEECDLTCSALARRRTELLREVREYQRTLREHGCGKGNE